MPLDQNGHEIPDPEPKAIPLSFKRPETLAEQIQRMVRTHVSVAAELSGAETFEEAEDFNTGDDDDDEPSTPYEMEFDPVIGREISADMIMSNPQQYRDDHLRAADDDEQLQRKAEKFKEKHGKRARGVPPEPNPPDPAPAKDENPSDKT